MTFSKPGSNCGTISREFIIFERNFIRLSVFIHAEGIRIRHIHYDFELRRGGGSSRDCFYIPYDEGTRAQKCRKSREASLHPATI